MTGTGDPRTAAFGQQATRFDDGALHHLTNKGLVRRAKKLLAQPPTVTETDTGLEVSAHDWAVSFDWERPLPEGHCPCATAGACQHVLAAIIHLRSSGATAPPSAGQDESNAGGPEPTAEDSGPSIKATLMAITDEDLLAWAKKADSRWALQRLAAIDVDRVSVSLDGSVTVELPGPHASVRFMGPALDEAIVKPSGRNDRRAVALAVLAMWLREGREPPTIEADAARPTELVGERSAVAGRAVEVCHDLLRIGLLHLGAGERERLDSLAASARGVKLYRLAILAERAADQVEAIQDLSPDADTARLLEQLAEISVVAETIGARLSTGGALPDGLCGLARARYENVGHLDLIGLGHYSWGDHRFAGSTGVLASRRDRIFTVTRPDLVNGRALAQGFGWEGVGGLASLSGRRVALSNAQASETMRLSAAGSVTATLGPSIGPDDLAELAWDGEPPTQPSRLFGQVAADWAVLAIEGTAGAVGFDGLTQRLEWPLRAAGKLVTARLSYRKHSITAVENLERLAGGDTPEFLVGRLRSTGSEFDLWPISAMVDGVLENLATTTATGAEPGAGPDDTTDTADTGETVGSDGVGGAGSVPNGPDPNAHLASVTSRLVRLAEAGTRPATSAGLASLSTEAGAWGFAALSQVMITAPDERSALLRAAWVAQLLSDLDGRS